MLRKAIALALLLAAASTTLAENHTDGDHDHETDHSMLHPKADVVPIDYMGVNDTALQGFLSVPSNATEGPLPAVIIIPDWDGVNEYEQIRATMIAQDWNFVGFAADIYGADLHVVEEQEQRIALAGRYRGDPELFMSRIQNAIDTVKSLNDTQVDPDRIALMGYCFGGTGVLSYVMLGNNDVAGVVSVHGGLSGVPSPEALLNETELPAILVLSGGDDDASSDIMDLEMTLDSIGVEWEITRYSNIEHAWTVFMDERYNPWADERTWESTGHFLNELFGITTFMEQEPAEDELTDEIVAYIDVDDTALRGYLAEPANEGTTPCVVIIPDWDGNNLYERQRAHLFAESGYVAFAADIYGADKLEVENITERIALAGMYRGNSTLFIQRMERAIEEVKKSEKCDANNIAMAGYCFGGTGNVQYAFSGRDDVKLIAAFHGGLTSLPNVTGDIAPYVMILSGGDDDAHGNQTELEMALNEGNAYWEISRWSDVDHGFTAWTSDAYNLRADARSWEQTLSAMYKMMPPPGVEVEGATSPNGDSSATNGGGSMTNGDNASSDDAAATSSGVKVSVIASAVVGLSMSIMALMM